jgi:hypothetical protein
VNKQDIHIVGTKIPQRIVYALKNVLVAGVVMLCINSRPSIGRKLNSAFGYDFYAIPQTGRLLEDQPKIFLTTKISIDISVIKTADAKVKTGLNDLSAPLRTKLWDGIPPPCTIHKTGKLHSSLTG